MSDRAEIGRELQRRIGRHGQALTERLAIEERQESFGLREPGEPSAALTEIQNLLARSPFTPDERARIRLAVGIDVLADIGLIPEPHGSSNTEGSA